MGVFHNACSIFSGSSVSVSWLYGWTVMPSSYPGVWEPIWSARPPIPPGVAEGPTASWTVIMVGPWHVVAVLSMQVSIVSSSSDMAIAAGAFT
ncbi:hypothetical protein [Methanogenium organophilum]|uniref:Uncharacterized protein n=1 Tax=Methanogenium organophilum TaxID=2199 RepID=A0A9X9S629_METOG|nr:hypothetical protein [Methanogenium organophilum]WAI02387.1 hypothetical protein OU421_05820 [Methanogenium organophilum]